MAKLKCFDCKEIMYRFKYVSHAVCNSCQRDKNNMRKRLKPHLEDEELKNWSCDCYEGLGFIMPPEYYCCFTCLAINPNFKKNEIHKEHKI